MTWTLSMDVCRQLKKICQYYSIGIRRIPLKQGLRWVPIWKSLPTYDNVVTGLSMCGTIVKKSQVRSCFPALHLEVIAWTSLMQFVHARGEQWSQGTLWVERIRYALDRKNNKWASEDDLEYFERSLGPQLKIFRAPFAPDTGRLGQTCEGGAKRRIFAIGNYVNQRLLKPVHDWAMEVLSTLSTDGTFNQTKPLDRLVGKSTLFSFDLKSATDRWPLVILFEMMCFLFDRSFASAAVNSCLACNRFQVPFVKRRWGLSFICGQPLGYYSSWPLFALSHQVWYCAERVRPSLHFTDYAVLGDDVIIANKDVATMYRRVLKELGVTISEQKSLISDSGCGEFAKRFRVRNMSVDLSPVSIRALKNFYNPYGLYAVMEKYSIKRFSTLCRIGGLGYRGLSTLTSSPSKRTRRLWAMFQKTVFRFSLKWWIGRGGPLNPY
ncbi:hypothetical protein ACSBR1_043968 (mitochondrion) [Camellia fascicularis]